jgi:EpsI family protein
MSPDSRQTLWLTLALLLVGAATWSFQLRPSLEPEPASLAAIPTELAGLHARDLPLEDTVERILNADYHVHRAYLHPMQDVVWLYLGYYGTERGGRSEHTPWVCYPAAGWTVVDSHTEVIDDGAGHRSTEIVVQRGSELRLVHFWYQSHRATGMLNEFDQALDRLLGRLLEGRADGAFVRISTPLMQQDEAGIELARARLVSFGGELQAQVQLNWPSEHAAKAKARIASR